VLTWQFHSRFDHNFYLLCFDCKCLLPKMNYKVFLQCNLFKASCLSTTEGFLHRLLWNHFNFVPTYQKTEAHYRVDNRERETCRKKKGALAARRASQSSPDKCIPYIKQQHVFALVNNPFFYTKPRLVCVCVFSFLQKKRPISTL